MSEKSKSSWRSKNIFFQLIVFGLGFFYTFVYYVRVPEPVDLQAVSQELLAYITVMLTLPFMLGIINLSRIHWRNVNKNRPNKPFSAVLLVSMYGMVFLSVFAQASPFSLDPKASFLPLDFVAALSRPWEFAFYKMLVPINAMIFALLAFFIASAAYRAFRIRTVESSIMLAAGILVILSQAPLVEPVWMGLPIARDWLLSIPNVAGQRGITIGLAIGIIAFTLRRLVRYPWD